ncbi:ABC transporter permease [Leifsonia sp. 71-9]|uniref:ABC transporter permease n=1 Tax=Leifsonia sp. 71-9 TaxID=1895934 RepID=UPI000926A0D5|nr:ABC transporter permease [Leifsonia sp. 71-9]OJX72904.1 MAG: ABC transporter permease [Leifsonia sp. 71-9]
MTALETRPADPAVQEALPSSRLRARDLLRLATAGLRARPARAVLSALGIAIGIAAMIAVVGISASSQARLNQQLASLGTNLLTATPGNSLFGAPAKLPADTIPKVRMIDGVERVSGTAALKANVYRSDVIDAAATGSLVVMAADPDLLDVTGATLRAGRWLDAATGRYPAVVLGATAAQRLGIVSPGSQVWLGGQYFTVIGILDPVPLAPELDTAALVGMPVAAELLGFDGSPTRVYERSTDASVASVRDLLGRTISPQAPDEVTVSRPSDALAAKNAADQAFTGLLVGLGSVALLVGGIGVANTMIISVLERRREIGLRRSLGAARRHIRRQFVAEALLLSALGGVAGSVLGAVVTVAVAAANGWPATVPPAAVGVGIVATLVIGAVAGLYPAIRAARIPPTAALSG